jgi:hypothetical protein
MKKFFFAVVIAAITFGLSSTPTVKANAQSTKLVSKTISAADTITFTSIPSRLKAFQYTFTESSGTTAGKVYLEGTVNGTWVALDSLTLADVGTAQTKVFPITSTSYLSYRFRNTNTSSSSGSVKAAYVRRTDE